MPNRVIVGTQWGDEGKAKIVDFATDEADIIIRFQGGANAGHTVLVGDAKFIFHLIPSGIMHPDKICVIGNGVVFDPKQFLEEVKELKTKNINPEGRIILSDTAHVVLPYHQLLDALKEKAAGKAAIGTTGRGIGPAYSDKVNRTGIRVCDLMDDKIMKEKIYAAVAEKNFIFRKLYDAPEISAEDIYSEYQGYMKKIRPYVKNSVVYINEALRTGKKLLFEGAQGTILDMDHGTPPFVTSSNTIAGAACVGSGVGPGVIDQVLGIVKAYCTRVGNGPFPTELEDEAGESLQRIGQEFGATTGRKRRCGWFDMVVLKKSVMVNGLTHLVFTKMDVMDDFEEIKICVAYEFNGEKLEHFPSQTDILSGVKPVYKVMPGWKTPTTEITTWEELPVNAKKYLKFISDMVNVPIGIVSVGPKRHQTIRVGF